LAFSRKNFPTILKEKWWKYAILGVLDVEANDMVILAYKYTTLASIQVSEQWLHPTCYSSSSSDMTGGGSLPHTCS